MFDNPPRIATLPGEVLQDEFMKPLGPSASMLARDVDVQVNRITGLIAETDPQAVTRILRFDPRRKLG